MPSVWCKHRRIQTSRIGTICPNRPSFVRKKAAILFAVWSWTSRWWRLQRRGVVQHQLSCNRLCWSSLVACWRSYQESCKHGAMASKQPLWGVGDENSTSLGTKRPHKTKAFSETTWRSSSQTTPSQIAFTLFPHLPLLSPWIHHPSLPPWFMIISTTSDCKSLTPRARNNRNWESRDGISYCLRWRHPGDPIYPFCA